MDSNGVFHFGFHFDFLAKPIKKNEKRFSLSKLIYNLFISFFSEADFYNEVLREENGGSVVDSSCSHSKSNLMANLNRT